MSPQSALLCCQLRTLVPARSLRSSFGLVCHIVPLLLLLALSPGILAQTPTAVPVTTWRYDLTHAGENTQETALTPSNVNTNSFGKLFSLPVDSTVYAQPLYVPGLTMSDGQVHNVVFVATENDSIYAFDADSNQGTDAKPIWQISLLTSAYGAGSGATAVPWQDTGSPDVAPTVGITGTPAINTATDTMYVVANTKENGVYFSRLHAINIITGKEQAGSPVNITATASGSGAGSSNGQITFSPLWENQRTAIDYYNGYVYFGYSAHGDLNNWHGWLFAYNASTLQQTAALCLSPNDIGAGVWGSGAGFPIDTSISGGRMFVVTGNGARSAPPFNSGTDYGESVVAFDIANGKFTPTDEFTPFNYQTLNSHDWDLGSGGLLMLPDQQGAYPHLLVTAGKEGRITLLNRDNLGGYASGASSNTNAVQDITGAVQQGQGFWSTAAYWNGNIYLWSGGELPSDGGVPNVGMLFKINSGLMSTSPDSKTTVSSAYPGPSFSISSNGTQDGIAWAVRSDQFNTDGPAVLYAFDANDLSKIFYESDTNSSRDAAGAANKFSVPVVTNGKVYVAAHGEVDVYGLLNGESTAAAPVITPNGGTFSTSQSVTMSTATSSASIYYTLDGSTPTTSSTQYTGPITISSNTTVKAIAAASGYLQSSVTTATFSFTTGQCSAPSSDGINVCSPADGASLTSPISINAAATVSGGVYRFELWSGSTKLASVSNSGVMNESLTLAPGSYTLTFTAYNTSGTHVYATRNITVTSGTSGGCSAPSSDGINVCSPNEGATVSSPVSISAAATVSGGVYRFELWSGSTKLASVSNSGTMTESLALAPGSYTLTFTAYNSSGTHVYATRDITVSGGSGGCTAPSSNGINVCSPNEGATVASPVPISAAATVSGGVYRFELWSGSTKLASVSNSGTMTESLALAPGSYTLTFTAYNTSGTHVYATRDITVSGTSSGSFSLSGSSFTIGWRGGSIHVPITVTPSGGFTGNVALSCSVSGPSGAVSVPACTVSTQPPAITGSSSVTGYVYITTQSTTTLGNYTLNVSGTGGGSSNSTSISFTVN